MYLLSLPRLLTLPVCPPCVCVCVSVYMYVCVCFCLSVSLSVSLSPSPSLSIHLSVYLSITIFLSLSLLPLPLSCIYVHLTALSCRCLEDDVPETPLQNRLRYHRNIIHNDGYKEGQGRQWVGTALHSRR